MWYPRRHRGGGAGFGRARAETAELNRHPFLTSMPHRRRRPTDSVVFGTVLLRGSNVVWYGDLEAEPIRRRWQEMTTQTVITHRSRARRGLLRERLRAMVCASRPGFPRLPA